MTVLDNPHSLKNPPYNMSTLPPQLEELARCFGVLTSYHDVYKKHRDVSAETVLAVLEVLGVDLPTLGRAGEVLKAEQTARLERGIAPVIVHWEGESQEFPFSLPAEQATGKLVCEIAVEDQSRTLTESYQLDKLARKPSPCGRFVTVSLPIPRDVGPGYHQLSIEHADGRFRSLLISAPLRGYSGEQDRRDWGCFLPLYSLKSARNWGAGDFTDLHNFTHWVAEHGGSVVGTLPMLAAFLDEPCDPSPYAPASRLAWNEFYLDVERIPEFAGCTKAAEAVRSDSFRAELAAVRSTELVEYRKLMALKRQVLEPLADKFFEEKPAARFARFERFLETHPHVENYAEFRAAQERRPTDWREWPDAMRPGQLTDRDFDPRSKQYHLYVQWVATNQLENLAEASGGGLYLDLPLGVRPDGYDVWRWHDLYATEASAGSPPDAMWTKGQDWGFPPLHPERIREDGYRHVRDYLRHHLRLARILRIDHVMQLHRLYWVPRGLGAHQGAYVQYRPEEFYAILNLESHRCRTTLVGENLGTVPPAVNEAMIRHGMQRMYVVQYEIAEEEVEEELEGNDFEPVRSDYSAGRACGHLGVHEHARHGDLRRVVAGRGHLAPAGSRSHRSTGSRAPAGGTPTRAKRTRRLALLAKLAWGIRSGRIANPGGDSPVYLRERRGRGARESGRPVARSPPAKRAGHGVGAPQLEAQSGVGL